MGNVKDVSRHVKHEVERELWGRAAARCQFRGHNKLLYKHGLTQEPVNLAEKAHIYSFSEAGPRGWGRFRANRSGINDISNLLLVCHDCHKLIDEDKNGDVYTADLLKQWKHEHENRVVIASGMLPSVRSHVVLYGARIGDENSPLNMGLAYDAIFPDWYAANDRPINLSMRSALSDDGPEFWTSEAAHLSKEFEKSVRPKIEEGDPNHFSVFALAPQPLLIQLGALFTDKVPVNVFQPIREPKTWKRQPHPDGFNFIVKPPSDTNGPPALLFSISDKVNHDRVHKAIGTKASIWEVTSNDCHNDCIRSEAQLSEFRQKVRKLFVDLRQAHPNANEILIFPAMPVSCAIELGRIRMPKADLPWVVFDQDKRQSVFVSRLTIGGKNE